MIIVNLYSVLMQQVGYNHIGRRIIIDRFFKFLIFKNKIKFINFLDLRVIVFNLILITIK